jgi:hypothetical protein
MYNKHIKRLVQQKVKIMKQLPPFGEILRGSFIECYLKCIKPNCKCHKDKKYRHGPYYQVSIRKKERVYHIYVPLKMRKTVKEWINNYNRTWQGIEEILRINIKLIRLGAKNKDVQL